MSNPNLRKAGSASELEETLLPHPEELECLLCARAVSRAAPGISLCTAWAGNQLGLELPPLPVGRAAPKLSFPGAGASALLK